MALKSCSTSIPAPSTASPTTQAGWSDPGCLRQEIRCFAGRDRQQETAAGLGVEEQHAAVLFNLRGKLYLVAVISPVIERPAGEDPLFGITLGAAGEGDLVEIKAHPDR